MAQKRLVWSRKEKFDLRIICTEVRFKLPEDKLSAREGIWILERYTCDLDSRIANFPACWAQSHEWGNERAEVHIFVRQKNTPFPPPLKSDSRSSQAGTFLGFPSCHLVAQFKKPVAAFVSLCKPWIFHLSGGRTSTNRWALVNGS